MDKALARPTRPCGAAGGGDRWDREPPAGASHLAREPALCWPPSSPGCLQAVALSACSSLFFSKLPPVRREVTLLPCEGGFSSKTRNVLNCLFAGVLIFELHANQGARISVLDRGRGWASAGGASALGQQAKVIPGRRVHSGALGTLQRFSYAAANNSLEIIRHREYSVPSRCWERPSVLHCGERRRRREPGLGGLYSPPVPVTHFLHAFTRSSLTHRLTDACEDLVSGQEAQGRRAHGAGPWRAWPQRGEALDAVRKAGLEAFVAAGRGAG